MCFHQKMADNKHPPFITKDGYKHIYAPNSPSARTYGTRKGYAPEHKVVMEKKIGGAVPDNKLVHHKDKNKLNNNPDNLELMTPGEHAKIHRLWRLWKKK